MSVAVDGEPAVWATEGDPSENSLGLTMVANAVAREHSDPGVDIPADAPTPAAQAVRNDPGGIAAAEGCISA
jgi:hypothetical protein